MTILRCTEQTAAKHGERQLHPGGRGGRVCEQDGSEVQTHETRALGGIRQPVTHQLGERVQVVTVVALHELRVSRTARVHILHQVLAGVVGGLLHLLLLVQQAGQQRVEELAVGQPPFLTHQHELTDP